MIFSFLLFSLFLSLPSGRSASPEAEIQGGHRARDSTSPPSYSYSSIQGSHEHYERIECTYIGSCEVSHGMGMEILNEAVDRLCAVSHRWLDVNVDVATSCIRISDTKVVQHCTRSLRTSPSSQFQVPSSQFLVHGLDLSLIHI